MATDYRMITFEGDLDDVAREFNAWASGADGNTTWRTETKGENKND